MKSQIYQITNEIKCLDEYVKAMAKVYTTPQLSGDFENLLMHINNLKAWAGIMDETNEGSCIKPVVISPFCDCFETDDIYLDNNDVEICRYCHKPIIMKCITFDKQAQDSLPQHIKDKMKANMEKAREERLKTCHICGGENGTHTPDCTCFAAGVQRMF